MMKFGQFKKGHKGLLDHPNSTSFKIGMIPWNKGKKCPQISDGLKGLRKGIPNPKRSRFRVLECEWCGKKFKRILSYAKDSKHIFCSRECAFDWRRTDEFKIEQSDRLKGKTVGELNGHWKGGIGSLQQRIRRTDWAVKWQRDIKKRDNHTCQNCRHKGGNLESHHIVPFKKIFQNFLKEYSQFSLIEDSDTLVRLSYSYKPFLNLDNGVTLCIDCHKEVKR